MDLDSVECVSSYDGMDEDEPSHLHHQFAKPHGGAAFNGATPAPGISPTTSINELLECPVCTNSMYPPIHQGLVLSMLFCGSVLFLCIWSQR